VLGTRTASELPRSARSTLLVAAGATRTRRTARSAIKDGTAALNARARRSCRRRRRWRRCLVNRTRASLRHYHAARRLTGACRLRRLDGMRVRAGVNAMSSVRRMRGVSRRSGRGRHRGSRCRGGRRSWGSRSSSCHRNGRCRYLRHRSSRSDRSRGSGGLHRSSSLERHFNFRSRNRSGRRSHHGGRLFCHGCGLDGWSSRLYHHHGRLFRYRLFLEGGRWSHHDGGLFRYLRLDRASGGRCYHYHRRTRRCARTSRWTGHNGGGRRTRGDGWRYRLNNRGGLAGLRNNPAWLGACRRRGGNYSRRGRRGWPCRRGRRNNCHRRPLHRVRTRCLFLFLLFSQNSLQYIARLGDMREIDLGGDRLGGPS
jgi:hypothetical protein